jgi:hypothetical protein
MFPKDVDSGKRFVYGHEIERSKGDIEMKDSTVVAYTGLGLIGLWLTIAAGWITHLVICIQAIIAGTSVSVGYAILLAAGALIPLLGAVHGIGSWFGAW